MSEPPGEPSEAEQKLPPQSKPVVIRVLRTLKRYYHIYKREYEADPKRNERLIANWTRRLGYLTIALAFIAAVTALILKETDQTSRLRDRAFLYFDDPPAILWPPGNAEVLGIGITIANAGNMPARKVLVQFACPVAPKYEEPFPLAKAKWTKAEIGSGIAPKARHVLQGCNIPVETIKAASRFELEVFYVLQATYLDGFDLANRRVTQVSRIFRFDKWGGQSLPFTPSPHNCFDDDCPK